MFHYMYNQRQLEYEAEKLLRKYDAERLYKAKPLDVYSVIEDILDVPYDWKYLTPDQSILGATAFKDGYIWAWPKPFYQKGMIPFKVNVEKGTILIDSTLTENENIGLENHTVLHEVFHQVIHKKCFRHTAANPYDYHGSTNYSISQQYKLTTDIDFIEWQANYCAAAFLMPKELLSNEFDKLFSPRSYPLKVDSGSIETGNKLRDLADEFNASQASLKLRLAKLGMITIGE